MPSACSLPRPRAARGPQPWPWQLGVLAPMFVGTGASALLFEQVFEKLLATVVGSATPAGAIVLAVYFAGLGLGGLGYGRLRRLVRRPLARYAVLEGVVGLYALALGLAFGPVQLGSARLVQLAGGSAGLTLLLRLGVASVWILPPATATGATYASIVGALRQARVARVPTAMAGFYALNVAGAVGGALAGPYLLFPWLGLTGTLLAIAALHALVVALALGLATALPGPIEPEPAPSAARDRGAAGALGSMLRTRGGRSLLVAAALSGFVVFGFEVVWIHLIGAVLGMSVYAFATMLAVVLLGLFVGGVLVSVAAFRRAGAGDWLLPVGLLLGTATLAATFGLWDDVPEWLLARGRTIFDFGEGERLRFAIALVVLGVPAAALGMVYPAIFRTSHLPVADADRAAGVLGAVNALGSVVGALGAGFVLVPALGSQATYRWLAVLPGFAATGLAAASFDRGLRRPGVRWRALGLLGTFGVTVAAAASLGGERLDPLALTSGVNIYFRRTFVQPSSRLRYWHEDVSGGITTVVEQRVAGQAVRTLLTNGKFQGNDSGETAAQIAFALLPCLVTPGRDRALVIGLGTGHSAEVVAAAGFAAIEIAEVSPGIVGAARQHFGTLNRAVLDDPRVRLFVEDGRNHLLRSRAHYDVITMELSGVWFAGAANLYSRQFYQLAADHLAPGGVLQQWIQLHHIAFEEVSSTLQAMRAVFPFVSVWLIGRQGILLGSARSVAPSPAALAALGASPGLDRDRAQLERSTGLTLARIEERLLLDADEVTALARAGEARGIPTTTDENRYVEYACPRHNLEVGRTVASTALELLDFALPAHRRARARQLGLGQ